MFNRIHEKKNMHVKDKQDDVKKLLSKEKSYFDLCFIILFVKAVS